ncbi:MAG: hypothetical protein K8T91_00385 [Planctomycetes bacterium]|nr:hypothetical protein [Planctomycetota bacterium]
MQFFPAEPQIGFRPTKKADVAEYPEVLHHVGLLFIEPPGTSGLLLI